MWNIDRKRSVLALNKRIAFGSDRRLFEPKLQVYLELIKKYNSSDFM